MVARQFPFVPSSSSLKVVHLAVVQKQNSNHRLISFCRCVAGLDDRSMELLFAREQTLQGDEFLSLCFCIRSIQ